MLTNRQLLFKEKHHQSTCQHETKIYNDYMYMYTHKVGYMVNNHNRCAIFNI